MRLLAILLIGSATVSAAGAWVRAKARQSTLEANTRARLLPRKPPSGEIAP